VGASSPIMGLFSLCLPTASLATVRGLSQLLPEALIKDATGLYPLYFDLRATAPRLAGDAYFGLRTIKRFGQNRGAGIGADSMTKSCSSSPLAFSP